MRDAEDDEGCSFDDFGEGRNGDEVGRKDDVGEVSFVLVFLVHELGEKTSTGDLDEKRERGRGRARARRGKGKERWGKGRRLKRQRA